ncbi:MAG: carboxylesterase family protein [Paludibacteraceae bacterium]|nr:carboxylesterase family protein [Paludibacteraceae bacterium]
MKRLYTTLFLVCAICLNIWAVKKVTYPYAERDSTLYLDVYMPEDTLSEHPCFIYLFGGGFKSGTKSQPRDVVVFEQLCNNGIVCVAIDYRLGLKNYEGKVIDLLNRLEYSINIATEDLIDATNFIIGKAKELKINPKHIILSGSSAGAITSLQADFYLQNGNEYAKRLPEGFKFGGVIAFAGAVAKIKGAKVKYKNQPAPTFFIHGTKDKLVRYNKIDIFGRGMYGSNALAKQFSKNGWHHKIMRYKNFGHDVAIIGFRENVPAIVDFINQYVVSPKYNFSEDVMHSEPEVKEPLWNINALRLYEKDVKPKVTKDPVQLQRLR